MWILYLMKNRLGKLKTWIDARFYKQYFKHFVFLISKGNVANRPTHVIVCVL